MKNRKLLSCLLALILIFAAFSVAVSSLHDCCGAHCPVCLCIGLCKSVVSVTAIVPVIVGIIAALISLFSQRNDNNPDFFEFTPVALHVKMSN